MGQRVVGDAGLGVGFDKRGVEVGFFARAKRRHSGGYCRRCIWAWAPPIISRSSPCRVMRLERRALSASSVSTTLRQIKRVDAGGRVQAEAHIGATNGIAHALVFVFRVDDKNFGAKHHAAQGFELDGKAFTGAGLGKDHRVAVFQAETVKDNQAGVVHVDAVQNAVVLAQVGAGEREAGAKRAGAHVAADLQLVDQLRHGAVKPLLLLGGGRLAVDKLLAEHGFDLVADKLQLLHAAGVDREVQAKAEEALFADLQFVAHFFGVQDGGLFAWVADPALFGVNLDAGFQLGNFFAQVFQHHLALTG